MYAFLLFFLAGMLMVPSTSVAQDASITRREGFMTIWQSIDRPAEPTREKPFIDVQSGHAGFEQITYAKNRGLLDDDDEHFRPDEPLDLDTALLWLFRTRSVERPMHDATSTIISLADPEDIEQLSAQFTLPLPKSGDPLTREVLLSLVHQLDDRLMRNVREASLYSEKFHGKGTAFGETFNMHALTAAHRTFPYNTLVRVTNVENEKSVVVRINDRGPFVQGRDIDLSLAAFTSIADRSKGKIQVTLERLGDFRIASQCTEVRRQMRVSRGTILRPGIPHRLPLGKTISLTSTTPFVIRDIVYPDGSSFGVETWVTKGESFDFSPSTVGVYVFRVGSVDGFGRDMRMSVVDCGMKN